MKVPFLDSGFRAVEYRRQSLWIAPLLGAAAGLAAGSLAVVLDQHVTPPQYWQYSPSTATTLLSAIVGAAAALTGFVVTVTVLVVQMATGQFSARYMRLIYRDRLLKVVLAVLVGTLTYAFSLLRHVENDFVPNIGVVIAGGLIVASLLLFLFFFDRCVHRLRPVAVAALVAESGRNAVITLVAQGTDGAPPVLPDGEPDAVVRATKPGTIQAIDAPRLVAWAVANDAVVVMQRGVGDFAPEGGRLAAVYGTRDADEVAAALAVGIERTIDQDPAFAVRIMVDIASRALSPAVNDPTTAVQVLNHLSELLRLIGSHDLTRHAVWRDAEGRVRLVRRTHAWADYLSLGVTEIRQYGVDSIQVMRRLRALLDELLETVRPEHRPAVEDELARLEATVAERWGGTVDEDRARRPDLQGIGGAGAV